jgi:N-acetylmuramoyl-L-alanine amidase
MNDTERALFLRVGGFLTIVSHGFIDLASARKEAASIQDSIGEILALGEKAMTTSPPPVDHLPSAIDTLARTTWGEARGEGNLGMQAVAAVVVNRTSFAPKWGDTVEAVCLQPQQFSCWNPQEPTCAAVDWTDPEFARSLVIALIACVGELPDPTNGATHYYADSIEPPYWAVGEEPCAVIGHHIFFKDIP